MVFLDYKKKACSNFNESYMKNSCGDDLLELFTNEKRVSYVKRLKDRQDAKFADQNDQKQRKLNTFE